MFRLFLWGHRGFIGFFAGLCRDIQGVGFRDIATDYAENYTDEKMENGPM